MMRSFIFALQFLTLLPVHLRDSPNAKEIGLSLIYYPLVGLLISVLLFILAWALDGAPSLLNAAILLAAWVIITGGLHIDGLADSADAWVGGLGDPVKTLAIMKDPNCGPAGVVSIVLVLLIKFTALDTIVVSENFTLLLVAPTLGRTVLLLLFLTTPYVRNNGLGSNLVENLPRRSVKLVILATTTTLVFLAAGNIIWVIFNVLLVFIFLRYMMIRRIKGMTGDVAGALVEVIEVVALLSGALTI